MTSPHTGLDIRDLMRHNFNSQSSMFANSLAKNTAPTFAPKKLAPSSRRDTDISFEADAEHEAQLRAAHGRRSAQRDAYLAAGPSSGQQAPPQLPTSFHQAASRHRLRATAGSSSREGSGGDGGYAACDGAGPPALLSMPTQALMDATADYMQAPVRAVPAGRGLSREGGGAMRCGARSVSGSGMACGGAAAGAAPNAVSTGGGGGCQPELNLSGTMMRPHRSSSRNAKAPSAGRAGSNGGIGSGSGGGSDGADGVGGVGGAGGAQVRSPPGRASSSVAASAGMASADAEGAGPTRMVRAREWSDEVEEAYRFQEAGYRDEREALALGHPPIERWPDLGLVRKLVTRESLGTAAESKIYFSKRRECEDKDLSKVKLYAYDS